MMKKIGLLVMVGSLMLASALYAQTGGKPMEKIATFAGGCFWCLEPPFDEVKGVYETAVGYTGGNVKNPSYEEVSSGTTGHAEAIQIRYNPDEVSYEELLKIFWGKIDPTLENRQFADIGSQYRTAIFYHDDEQRQAAETSKKKIEEAGIYDKPIVTEILPAQEFYPAEEYHQDYYKKNPLRYKAYYYGSGRAAFCPLNAKAISAAKILETSEKTRQ